MIRLDIHPTADGRAVQDLTAADLDLLEDGTPQKIETLTHAAGPARSFVVFLDTPHMRFEGARDVRVALVRFLDRLLGEDDMVGVMTPEMTPPDIRFGPKESIIPAIMQDETFWERARVGSRDPKEDRYAQCFPANEYRDVASEMQERHREQATLDAFSHLVDFLSTRDTRTAVITLTDGWRLFGPNGRLSGNISSSRPGGFGGIGGGGGRGRGGFPGGGGFPRGRGGQGGANPPQGGGDDGGREVSAVSRTECEADRLALAALDDSRRLDRIVDAANRAMTAFYTIYARAIAAEQTPNGRPPAVVANQEQDPASRMDAMRQLAVNTDGMAIMTTAALDGGLTRIAGDMAAYDVLTYRSTNNRLDGKFRTVTVRSLRPGVAVRTRRGYRGASVDDVLSGGTSTAVDSAFGSVAAVSPRANFRVRTALARAGDASDAMLWVIGELDYRARREVTWTAGAVADITLVGADGQELVAKSVDVAANALSFTMRAPETGGLAPGEYAVRVRLRPNNQDGLPVAETARVVVPRTLPALGDSLLWRRGTSTGPQYVITADPRFQHSDRIRVEIPTSAAGTPGGRMLDRFGKPNQVPVKVSERQDESTEFRWIVADAVLAPLAPGDYAIEVTLGDAKQVTAFQLVP
ncbi:MAG TPA: VWA domain-containing protein [Vicinamibacterales bacterium]|nr:VWA domain-containing protein [Vicinamibacterales bacterium]